MKYLVLGAGMMGSAAAFDLARSKGTTLVTLADIDGERARSSARALRSPIARPVALDVNSFDETVRLMAQHDCALGATSFHHNVLLTKAAIESGTHFLDLGGSDDVLNEQLRLNDDATRAGVTIVPNCGLAPGLVNIIAAARAREFEEIESIHIRVGCVPQFPRPPLNHQILSSVEGLLHAYTSPCVALRNGTLSHFAPLTETETLSFPPTFTSMEAFLTSGGLSLLPQLLEGKARDLDLKSIRHIGHCERIRALLELGFGSSEPISVGSNILTSREFFLELLKRRMVETGKDAVLCKIEVKGVQQARKQLSESKIIDFFSENDNITGTMRMSAYPISIVAQLLVGNRIATCGVVPPEICVPYEDFLGALAERGIRIDGSSVRVP
jgi:lysine 6-dehydrogenase